MLDCCKNYPYNSQNKAKLIKLYRLQYNYPARYIAKMMGISTSYYSKIESGKVDAGLSFIVPFALLFDMSPADFLRHFDYTNLLPHHHSHIIKKWH